jgi:hypothetical protein
MVSGGANSQVLVGSRGHLIDAALAAPRHRQVEVEREDRHPRVLDGDGAGGTSHGHRQTAAAGAADVGSQQPRPGAGNGRIDGLHGGTDHLGRRRAVIVGTDRHRTTFDERADGPHGHLVRCTQLDRGLDVTDRTSHPQSLCARGALIEVGVACRPPVIDRIVA